MSATLDMGANSLIGLEIIVLLRKQCPRPFITNYDWSTGAMLRGGRTGKNKDKIILYYYNLSVRPNNFPNTTQTDRETAEDAKKSKSLIKGGRCAAPPTPPGPSGFQI